MASEHQNTLIGRLETYVAYGHTDTVSALRWMEMKVAVPKRRETAALPAGSNIGNF